MNEKKETYSMVRLDENNRFVVEQLEHVETREDAKAVFMGRVRVQGVERAYLKEDSAELVILAHP